MSSRENSMMRQRLLESDFLESEFGGEEEEEDASRPTEVIVRTNDREEERARTLQSSSEEMMERRGSKSPRSSNGDDARITRDKYLRMCQFRTMTWEKPIARQLYATDGSVKRLWYLRSATTYDLMLDILYVAMFIQMSKAFYETIEIHDSKIGKGLWAFFAVAIPLFNQWLQTVNYLNRFDSEDYVHLLYFFFNAGAIAFLGLHLEDCSSFHYSSSCTSVVLSIGGLRLGVTIMQFYASVFNERTKTFVFMNALRNLVISSLWIFLGLFLPWGCDVDQTESVSVREWSCCPWENQHTEFFYCCIIVIDFVLIILFDRGFNAYFDSQRRVPLDLDLVVERVGMLITVAIATTVVMITFYDRMTYYVPINIAGTFENDGRVGSVDVHGSFSQPLRPPHPPPQPPGPRHGKTPDTEAFEYTMMVSLIALLINTAYFNLDDPPAPSRSRPDGPRHALVRSWYIGLFWTFSHLPLLSFIFLAGASLFDFVQKRSLSFTLFWNFTVCLSSANVVMTLQQLLHVGGGALTKRRWRKRTRVTIRFVLSACLLLVSFLMDHKKPVRFVIVQIVVFLALIAVSLYGRHSLDTSDALFGLSSAVTESLLAEQMLSAEVGIATVPRPTVDAASRRSEASIRRRAREISSKNQGSLSNALLSSAGEVSEMKRELLVLKQKQWVLEKERDVALRRERESASTIGALRIKLRDTMQELQDQQLKQAAANRELLHTYDGQNAFHDNMDAHLARIADEAALGASQEGRSP